MSKREVPQEKIENAEEVAKQPRSARHYHRMANGLHLSALVFAGLSFFGVYSAANMLGDRNQADVNAAAYKASGQEALATYWSNQGDQADIMFIGDLAIAAVSLGGGVVIAAGGGSLLMASERMEELEAQQAQQAEAETEAGQA